MDYNKPIIEDNTINLSSLYFFIKKYIIKILKFSLILVLLYIFYFFIKTPFYSSEVSFYTSYNKANSSSVLSFLPSNFGIQPESSLSFSVENFLSSDKLLKDIVQKEYLINDEKLTLVEHWGKNYNKFFTINPIGLLSKINSRAMDNYQMNIDERKLLHATRILRDSIIFSEDRNSFLNTISVVSDNSNLSYQIVEELYNAIIGYSNEITNIKGKEKREFINSRLLEVKSELENYENQLLNFLETNKNLNSPSLILQKDRIEKDITLYRQLYFTLSDQRELAIIDEKDNTSSIFLLDSPHISSKKVGLTLFEGIFIIFIFSFLISSCYYIYNNRKELII